MGMGEGGLKICIPTKQQQNNRISILFIFIFFREGGGGSEITWNSARKERENIINCLVR